MEQFRVENPPQLSRFDFRIDDGVRGHGESLSFALSFVVWCVAAHEARCGKPRHTTSWPAIPAFESIAFLDDYEKGSVKGVFGIVTVMQYAPADTQDHRPMPAQDCRERRFRMPLPPSEVLHRSTRRTPENRRPGRRIVSDRSTLCRS
jgi:hypothetical protein